MPQRVQLFVVFAVTLIGLGVATSWSAARLAAGRAMTRTGPSANSAYGLYKWNARRSGRLESGRWNGWIWQAQWIPGSSGVCVRRIASWPGSETVPERPPPRWSASMLPYEGAQSSKTTWRAHYEAGFGWPLICLVSEDVEVSDGRDSPDQPLPPVFVVQGARVHELSATEGIRLSWLGPPWHAVTGGEDAPERAFQWIRLPSGVYQSVPTALYLPTRISWVGLIGNAIVHGTILFVIALCVVWIPRGVRAGVRLLVRDTRAARARRGECRACGHPLAGLARCPECGTVVK